MRVTFTILRYNPQLRETAHWQDFTLELAGEDRVLDGLIHIKHRLDGSLAFRRSCAHGVCGSDAMIINGTERLACQTLLRDLQPAAADLPPAATNGTLRVLLEPLRCLPVERDLMVDQEAFFTSYRSVKPFLINAEPTASGERVQSPADREKFADVTKCILCASCYSACPVLREKNPRFVGPAALVNGARFVFDSRDSGLSERLPVLDAPDGVWGCENKFRCTQVCPRGIGVTKSINQTKRKIDEFKKQA